MPAIPSSSFVSRRRHPSRLPYGTLRAALTEPGGDARRPFPERREWQALFWQNPVSLSDQTRGRQCR